MFPATSVTPGYINGLPLAHVSSMDFFYLQRASTLCRAQLTAPSQTLSQKETDMSEQQHWETMHLHLVPNLNHNIFDAASSKLYWP